MDICLQFAILRCFKFFIFINELNLVPEYMFVFDRDSPVRVLIWEIFSRSASPKVQLSKISCSSGF